MKLLSSLLAFLTLLLSLGCKKTDPTPPAPEMRTVTYTFKSEAPRYTIKYTINKEEYKTATVNSDTSFATTVEVGSSIYLSTSNGAGYQDVDAYCSMNNLNSSKVIEKSAKGFAELYSVVE